jgi:quercetin dioxygenase-like cupin family protein
MATAQLRAADLAALASTDGRVTQRLLEHASGATSCEIVLIKTPPGDASPEGLHTHLVDQHFYVLVGTLSVEFAGKVHEAPAGVLVHIPAGVPHRNWNGGNDDAVFLAINAPVPDRERPFAVRVG